jgi:hypothetical protein
MLVVDFMNDATKCFLEAVAVGASLVTILFFIILIVPVFSSNMPINVVFYDAGKNCTLPFKVELEGTTPLYYITPPGMPEFPVNGEAVFLEVNSAGNAFGQTYFAYNGGINVTASFDNGLITSTPLQPFTVSKCGLYDLMAHNILFVGYEWNPVTQTWILETPVAEFYK